MGSLVVTESDSRPESLGSMPDATKFPPSTHGFNAEIVEAEIGGVAIYRPFGEFRRAKSYCHLYGAQGQRPGVLPGSDKPQNGGCEYLTSHYKDACHDEFRGPR
ncbi:hypothetical protein TNCV_4056691 [Trichonephila clavipes]|nr:hypothetical protein TNCV_4056691 [Trichonephila clavipes]